MAQLGTAYVQIVPSAQGISGKIQKVIAPEASAAGTKAGEQIHAGMSSRLSGVGKGLMKAGAIATAVSVPIIAGIKSAMSAYQVQNAAETKLTEIYKTRMGASKQAAAETMKLASALQREGVVGDEVALSGAQQLATFAKYPSTVNSLMPAMENLLVQQKGLNGTTQDATQIANLMGKVMNGQTGALKRVGVSFTAAQEKVLKYGTESEKAAMLSKVITQNVGNMNQAMLATPEGKIQQMKNSLGDLAETAGAALAPAISSIAQFVSTNLIPKVEQFLNFVQANPVIGKVVTGITAVLAVGGPLAVMIGGLMTKIGPLISKIGSLKTLFTTLTGPIGIAAAAFLLLYTKSETFRNAVNSLGKILLSSLKPILGVVMRAFKQLAPPIMSLISTIGKALAPVIKALIPVIRVVINVLTSIMRAVIPALSAAIKVILNVIRAVVSAVIPIVKKIFDVFSTVFNAISGFIGPIVKKIGNFISNPIKTAKDTIKSVTSKISDFLHFNGLGKKISKVFDGIKSFITDPIETAKNTIKKIIDKIKGLFPINLGKILSFKLPNVYKKTGKKKGEFAFGASWHSEGGDKHAKGGIFRQPTLLSSVNGANHIVGEAGPEAILPLNTLWKQMDRTFGSAQQPIQATYNITVDGAKDPAQFAKELVHNLKMEMRS